jgi:hypothetical protein
MDSPVDFIGIIAEKDHIIAELESRLRELASRIVELEYEAFDKSQKPNN